LEHFFIFPDIGKNHPNWLIFFRGVETTNQICIYTANTCKTYIRIYIYIYIVITSPKVWTSGFGFAPNSARGPSSCRTPDLPHRLGAVAGTFLIWGSKPLLVDD
jgi:hypothetical protein